MSKQIFFFAAIHAGEHRTGHGQLPHREIFFLALLEWNNNSSLPFNGIADFVVPPVYICIYVEM